MRSGLKPLLLALLLALSPVTGNSQDALDVGPAVGEQIPHDISTRNQYDQEVSFRSLAHRRGLIILFSRSLDW